MFYEIHWHMLKHLILEGAAKATGLFINFRWINFNFWLSKSNANADFTSNSYNIV